MYAISLFHGLLLDVHHARLPLFLEDRLSKIEVLAGEFPRVDSVPLILVLMCIASRSTILEEKRECSQSSRLSQSPSSTRGLGTRSRSSLGDALRFAWRRISARFARRSRGRLGASLPI